MPGIFKCLSQLLFLLPVWQLIKIGLDELSTLSFKCLEGGEGFIHCHLQPFLTLDEVMHMRWYFNLILTLQQRQSCIQARRSIPDGAFFKDGGKLVGKNCALGSEADSIHP